MRKYVDIDINIFNPFTNANPRYYRNVLDRRGQLNSEAKWYFNVFVQTNMLFEFGLQIGDHWEPWTSIFRFSLFGFTVDFKTGHFVTWNELQEGQ